jgi:hypothetical protein
MTYGARHSEADQIVIAYKTAEDVWKASGEAYRAWRSHGQSEGEAARSASEFYAYQMSELRKRDRAAGEIETVCAWCVPHKHLSGPVGAPPERVSHGICEKCLEEKFPERVGEAVA